LDEKIGGVSTLTKLPEAIFVLDVRHEKTAVQEARKCGVKVVAICDTNVNVSKIDYVIPANDDSVGSVTMMTKLIADAVSVGAARAKSAAVEVAQKAAAPAKAEKVEAVLNSDAKEAVADLDDKVNESLAREQAEEVKK
jgi:small subunit ribosomal protein S2